jgi:hypothetical protein
VAYAITLTWENPDMRQLEPQARAPLFGAHPVELGGGDRARSGVILLG